MRLIKNKLKDAVLRAGCLAAGVGLVGLVYIAPYFLGSEDDV